MWAEDWLALIGVCLVFCGGVYGFFKLIDNSSKSDCNDAANQYKVETEYKSWHGCQIILKDGTKIDSGNWEDVAFARGWFDQ